MIIADLFSGIGGFHIAAKQAIGDISLAGFAEVDPTCIKIYQSYFKISEQLPFGDIKNLVSGTQNEWGFNKIDILFGGFPCQPFSNVGKRQGLSDDRSNVFFDLLRVIRYYKPTFFVLENVEKIKTLEKGAILAMLVKELEKLSYQVDIQLLCAKDYGIPQQRKRIFFCGRLHKKRKRLTPLPLPKKRLLLDSRYPTTWHLLERAMPDKHIVPVGSRKTIFTKNEKWMGDLEIDRAIARPICATMGKWHRANQDNYYTEYYIFSDGGIKMPSFDYMRHTTRRLMPIEALRLQGFPEQFNDHYSSLQISPTAAYKTIGNAVPVDLASAVISNLINQE